MDRHGPIHLGEGQAVALIGDDLGGVRLRIPQPDRVVMAPRGEDRPAAERAKGD
jgi:hypothetical protein